MSRFQTLYREAIVPELIKKFGYKTVMQVPRITKITLNMGVGEAVNDKKLVENALNDMTISPRLPVKSRLLPRPVRPLLTLRSVKICRSVAW